MKHSRNQQPSVAEAVTKHSASRSKKEKHREIARPTTSDTGSVDEARFQNRQLNNLMKNYRRVDAATNKLLADVVEMRSSVTEAQQWKNEIAGLHEQINALNKTLQVEVDRVKTLQIELEDARRHIDHQYHCAVQMAKLPHTTTAIAPDAVISAFAKIGVTGLVEKIELQHGQHICIGWATKHRSIGASLFITLYDSDGCLGFGVPSSARDDVAAALDGSESRCGFSFPLIRRPVGLMKPLLNVIEQSDNPSINSVAMPIFRL